jgi:MFS family permease
MFHGLGISFFGTASMTWIADMSPASRRAEAMGFFGNSSQVAIAIAPLLAALIYGVGGFPVLFAVAAVVGACGLSLVSLSREEGRDGQHPTSAGSFRQALGRLDVLAITFGLLTAAATWGIIIGFLPIFTAERNAGPAAPFYTIYAVVTIVFRLFIGPVADRMGRRVVAGPALFLLAATMIVLSFLSSAYMLWGLAVIYAVSFGTLYPTLSAFLVDVAPAAVRGSAIGVLTAGFDLGIMLGSYVGGVVAESLGLGPAFAAAGVLCLAGAIVFWVGTRAAKKA